MRPLELIRRFRSALFFGALGMVPLGCFGVSSSTYPSSTTVRDEPSTGVANEVGPYVKNGLTFRFQCNDPSTRGTTDVGFRRITKDEMIATLTDALPAGALSTASEFLNALPEDRITTAVEDSPINFSEVHSNNLPLISEKIAEAIIDDPARGSAITGDNCMQAAPVTEACARKMVSTLAPRLFRKTQSAEELENFVQGFNELRTAFGDKGALKVTLSRLLLAPRMLFHVENGQAMDAGLSGRIRLTPEEVAARLAYRIEGAAPDAELLSAARTGLLETLEDVQREARRLLSKERSVRRVEAYFAYYLGLAKMREPLVESVERRGLTYAGIKEEMLQETKDFLSATLAHGTFPDLFISKKTFAKSDRMATILGTTPAINGAPVEATNGRMGVLMRPPLLVVNDPSPSIVKRGLIIRTRILCDPIGSPPDDLVSMREEELKLLNRHDYSNREYIAKKTEPSACQGCHANINPLGFALEGFDELGQMRTADVLVENGQTYEKPLNTVVTQLNIDSREDSVNNAQELATKISTSWKARACYAQHLFRYTRAREESLTQDACVLHDVEEAIAAGEPLSELLLRSVASPDIFWMNAER